MRLTIDISRQDYADFNKFHFFKTKLKRTVMVGALTIIFLQLFLNREQFDLTLTVISSIVCVIVYVFVIYRGLNKTKSIPNNDGAILGQKEVEFAEDKIIYKTANSEGSSDWTTIKKLEESSKAFYLYMDANMAILVPKKVFKDKADEDAFKTMVRQKMSPLQKG
ncbi:MAG: YcxB family protein [Cryomorphaceae bacterium]|nr:YcxB family protein [Cryomorphaceae bacterium]